MLQMVRGSSPVSRACRLQGSGPASFKQEPFATFCKVWLCSCDQKEASSPLTARIASLYNLIKVIFSIYQLQQVTG